MAEITELTELRPQAPHMAAIKSLGVDPVDMPQAPGKIRIWGLNQEVIVLCEALDYVKLSLPAL
jgi:hypothetical protein